MAEPVTILAVINGSVGLALKIGTVIKDLYSISQKLKYAELEIISIVGEIETIQTAWSEIERWARVQLDGPAVESNLLERLERSIMAGTMVISAFEDDLLSFSRASEPTGFLQRSKIVFNEAAFVQHQDRIRGQVGAMTLLLQVISLSSSSDRIRMLEQKGHVLRDSDETSWTIVQSRISTSTRTTENRSSTESSELTYRQLDFENDLFTARVYKRNYRPTLIMNLFKPDSMRRHKALDKVLPATLRSSESSGASEPLGHPQISEPSGLSELSEPWRPQELSRAPTALEASEPPETTTPPSTLIDTELNEGEPTKMCQCKFIVLGDHDSRKTELATWFCLSTVNESGGPTIEDTYRKEIKVDGIDCVVEVLDIADEAENAATHDQWIRDGDAFILCYSITSHSTFGRIQKYLEQVRRVKAKDSSTPHIYLDPGRKLYRNIYNQITEVYSFTLVGIRSDKLIEREVSTAEAYSLAKELGCAFVEVSTESHLNVEKMFVNGVRQIWEMHQLVPVTERISNTKGYNVVSFDDK